MKRLALKVGDYYAIKPSAIERDADGFFLIVGDSVPETEARGSVAVVHVRGALSQFEGEGGDSYEAIVKRVASAMASDPKPTSIVLCISSPGGIVAGLNECVFKLQRMSAETKIPLVAYLNELAASAAMALCCACSKRLAPPSAIVGSIGTISTMVSMAAHDKAEGLDFRIITSGKRKSDGHPHVEISTDAVKAERARNAELAEQFYGLASKALGMSLNRLEDMEAAIFVGDNARKAGLVDKIITLDAALTGLDRTETDPPTPAPNTGNITDRRAKELDKPTSTGSLSPQGGVTNNVRPGVSRMNLKALISKTEAAISTETDPGQLRVLQAKLGTLLARAEMDGDDEPEKKKKDGDDDGDGGDESKAAKAAKKEEEAKRKAEAAKHRAKAAEHRTKMEESEEEAKRCEESEEETAARHRATPTSAHLSPGAAAALVSQNEITAASLKRIDALEKDATARQLHAMIDEARAARRITPGEAKTLAKKDAGFVRDFLEMRPKALVATDETALAEPDRTAAADVPAFTKSLVEADIKFKGLEGDEATKYREKSYAAHRAAQAGAVNGAGGTY